MPYKLPISILILAHTIQMDILLLQRRDRADFWQSITGSMETEDILPYNTAVRELLEETGLNAKDYLLTQTSLVQSYEIYPFWRYRYAPNVTRNEEHVFTLELPHTTDIILSAHEHISFEWTSIDTAINKVFSWTNKNALQLLKEDKLMGQL